MKVNIYDFDKTIYDGDSSLDFYIFCIKRKFSLILNLFPTIFTYILYYFRLKTKKDVKEIYFSFLKNIDDIDEYVSSFWKNNEQKIKQFYLDEKDHSKDIIISASPEFLLIPICQKLETKDLIGSIVDKKTGKFVSENCKGEEKIKRLKEKYKKIVVENTYTDSLSDLPIIKLAKNAYIVDKDKIKKMSK